MGARDQNVRNDGLALGAGLLFAVSILGILLTYCAARWAEDSAISALRADAVARLELHATSLDGALEKYRILPALLARRRDVIAMFAAGREPGLREPVLHMAELQTAMTGASEVNFVSPEAEILVSSTPGRAGTMLPRAAAYIQAALQGRLGRDYAGDGRSGGYTFASPVRQHNRIIGVVTATVRLERIEQSWALSPEPIVATDRFGFVYLSNQENWRFRRLARDGDGTDGDRRIIAIKDQEDGSVTIPELPLARAGLIDVTKHMAALGWTLHLFADLAPARAAKTNAALIAGLAALLSLGALWAYIERRRRLSAQRRSERATALRLERRVRDRTKELTAANAALEREVCERLAAEKQLRLAQAELIQAAKLAGLGQMSAMLAHEFNQPLTAIRSLADNAELLLVRNRQEEATDNLRRIAGLVVRLGELSRTLKTFARKPGSTMGSISLTDVVDHALLLVGPRLRRDGAGNRTRFEVARPASPVLVRADQVRLEQVAVNLITNALDAVSDRADGHVQLEIAEESGLGLLRIADNGPGIPLAQREQVFDPFFTTKTVGEGLGLGLSIVYNIVKDFDGRIVIKDAPGGGALFEVSLPLAAAAGIAAE